MLRIVLKREMQARGLSSHAAAEAIGVSHTTILRALKGETVDVDTIIKLAKFLGMKPSELLDTLGDSSSLAEQISVLLSHSRDFEKELAEAVARVRAGTLSVDALRDVVSYAVYKFNSTGDQKNVRGTRSKSR